MPAPSSADRDPLDRLAEEFVTRFRAGERPSLTEYAARLPDRADEVRELFPTLVELERLKPNTADCTGDYAPAVGPSDPVRVGEFRILRRIGVGGMGAVYEAVQESLGRHVALKLLPLDAVADPKRLERFRREAKAAARLHHTNIVPVFGTGEADGRHFYAMQFISGHPLDAVIDEVRRLKDKSPAVPRAVSGVANALVTGTFAGHPSPLDGEASADATLPAANPPSGSDSAAVSSPSLSDGGRAYWSTVARLGAQAADALAYAHAQGVLHRDIKPANLLLDLRGTVWVADFGLAKSTDADDLTHAGDFIGTIRYMAPERFEGAGDRRADVYALGLTLYELLTLRPAFRAANRAKLVEQVIAASPPRPRTLDPHIPRDLETVVLKAIARDPAGRYQTAGELADDLRRYVEDRPIRARRATPQEQAWRWCRRNPAVAGLLAAVLLVFATGAGVSLFFAGEAGQKAQAARDEAGLKEEEKRKVIDEQGKLLAEQDRTRLLLHASRMNLAQVALNEGRIGRLIELLDEMRPAPGERDLRGWEWHYLWRLCHRESSVHRIPEFSDDPNSPSKGISTVLVHASGHHALLLRPDFAGRPNVESKVWFGIVETATGKFLWKRSETVSNPNPSQVFATSEDGRFAAFVTSTRNEPRLRLFDTRLDREIPLKEPTLDYFSALHVSPNGEQIVACTHSSIPGLGLDFPGDLAARPLCVVWDVKRATVRRIPLAALPGSNDTPDFATPTPDGRTVIVTLNRDGDWTKLPRPFEAWDVTGDQPKRLYKLPDDALDFATSPGGTVLVVRTESGTRRILSAATGKVIRTLVPTEQVDGKLWTDRDTPPGWVSDDGDTLAVHTYAEPSRLAVTRRLAGDSDQWQTSYIHYPAQQMTSLALSKDGGRLVASDHMSSAIRTWDLSQHLDYAVVWTRPKRAAPGVGGELTTIHTTSDDRRVVVRSPMFGGPDRPERHDPEYRKSAVIDGRTGRELQRLSPPDGEPALAVLSPDGERVVLSSMRPSGQPGDAPGGGVEFCWKLYETTTGRLVAESEKSISAGQTGFSPDGLYLVTPAPVGPGDPTGVIRLAIRDPRTAKVLALTPAWPETQSGSYLFDPRGRWLVLWMFSMDARPGDRRIVCLDLATGRELWSKTEPNHGFLMLAASPDGKQLLAGQSKLDADRRTSEAVVRTLDPATGDVLSSIPLPPLVDDNTTPGVYRLLGGIYHLAFSADGKKLVVSHGRELFVKTLGDDSPPLRLVGNEQDVAAVQLDPGGRRAFTLETATGYAQGRRLGIKVWDLESGRELITVPLPTNDYGSAPGGSDAQFWIENERLRVLTPEGIREYDGTPVREGK